MSNKLKKKSTTQHIGRQISFIFLQMLTVSYVFLMLSVFPLFYQEGKYRNMGEAKFLFFRNITLVYIVLFLLVGLVHLIQHIKEIEWRSLYRRLSAPDWFVLCYLLLVLVSFCLSDFKANALWGYEGWYMGLYTQLGFGFLYFAISRYWSFDRITLAAGSLAAMAVFLFGVLHRFMIDPLLMYEGINPWYFTTFLSTIGQSTWYSSYLCTVFPLGAFFYWKGEQAWERLLGFFYLILGFSTMVTQNSDSAFIGFLLILFVFFYFSLEQRKDMLRFLEMLLIGLVSFQGIGILQRLFPVKEIQLEPLSLFTSQSPLMLLPLAAVLLLYLLIRLKTRAEGFGRDAARLQKASLILLAAAAVLAIAAVLLVTWGILPEELREIGYLYFDEQWGNGRGFTWKYAADMYVNYPLKDKLFGCGPDCFAWATQFFRAADVAAKWGSNVLTNTHNEWFTALMFYGAAGALAYIGIFLSALLRFAGHARYCPLLVAVAAAIAGYMGHNIFCYQQVVCTSLIFILMGIGEWLVREES